MSPTSTAERKPRTPLGREIGLPIVDSSLSRALQAERHRLTREIGLFESPVKHFKQHAERPFTKTERDRVTILFGGLSLRHEELILEGLRGLGYRVGLVPTPAKPDFQAGKEYGNNGQCNPTYFTVGALVNHLKNLRDKEGLSTRQIVDDYVFMTAGACGPCRFGMYEAEYRLALHNSGFDGFRVLLFQQGGGVNQADEEAGMRFDLNFFLVVINSVLMGDLLNEVGYHTAPYEVEPGRTREVMNKCLALCQDKLRTKNYAEIRGKLLARILNMVTPASSPDDVQKYLDQLRGDYYTSTLEECARIIDDEIEVDYTFPKPIVKITGEFWAQTTEGDGNYKMFRFLQSEGAEVLVEPVTTWITYILNQARNRNIDRRGLHEGQQPPHKWHLPQRAMREIRFHKKMLKLNLADKITVREYERLRAALGGSAHKLACQHELLRMGHPYYHSRSGGGEGHLEVAKNIYYTNKDLAHMVLSLKPFGCMPSTQSDGAQAAVVSNFADMIYLPVETSGEGDVNAHSRVQMALGEAKFKCKAEFKNAVERTGYSLQQIREYVGDHRELRRPLQPIPHHKGVIGRAANFVLKVGKLMDQDPRFRTQKKVGATMPQGTGSEERRTACA